MREVAASVEASQLLRTQRVDALQQQLRDGDFDPARYASTPRKRAEILAQVLTRVVSRSAMRRRLKSLGVSREYCGGTLMAISVEGGGIDVRRADGTGQVVTGPGVDARLLEVFPELVGATLRNLTYNADAVGPTPPFHANSAYVTWTTGDPLVFNEDSEEAWNLGLFLSSYTATDALIGDAAIGRFSFVPFCSQNLLNVVGESTYINVAYANMNAELGGCAFTAIRNFGIYYRWPAAGVNWCNTHAEQTYAVVGPMHFEATLVNGATVWSPVDYGFRIQQLAITYTDTGCDTCSLDLQVNSDCDGTPVQGGVFALDNGMECTQDGSGTCTITGIPHGTYAWTWTKTGYEPQSGEFVCDCSGGGATIFLSVIPEGGCPGDPCDLTIQVNSACDGEPVEGGVFVIGEQECTQDAAGTCTITDIPNGNRTWTWTNDGWLPQTGEFDCDGGASELFLEVTPVGGCPEAGEGNIIVGVPNSAAALLEAPRSGAVQVGAPVGGQLMVRARRQKPYPEA